MLCEQTGACVLFDAEKAEEGEEAGAPVAGVDEGREVEGESNGKEIFHGECLGWLVEVGVPVPVGEASPDAIVEWTARQRRVAEAEDVVVDRGDEAREGRDAAGLSEEDANSAEAAFGDGSVGVYADGAAKGPIDALTGGVCTLRVEG